MNCSGRFQRRKVECYLEEMQTFVLSLCAMFLPKGSSHFIKQSSTGVIALGLPWKVRIERLS